MCADGVEGLEISGQQCHVVSPAPSQKPKSQSHGRGGLSRRPKHDGYQDLALGGLKLSTTGMMSFLLLCLETKLAKSYGRSRLSLRSKQEEMKSMEFGGLKSTGTRGMWFLLLRLERKRVPIYVRSRPSLLETIAELDDVEFAGTKNVDGTDDMKFGGTKNKHGSDNELSPAASRKAHFCTLWVLSAFSLFESWISSRQWSFGGLKRQPTPNVWFLLLCRKYTSDKHICGVVFLSFF